MCFGDELPSPLVIAFPLIRDSLFDGRHVQANGCRVYNFTWISPEPGLWRVLRLLVSIGEVPGTRARMNRVVWSGVARSTSLMVVMAV